MEIKSTEHFRIAENPFGYQASENAVNPERQDKTVIAVEFLFLSLFNLMGNYGWPSWTKHLLRINPHGS